MKNALAYFERRRAAKVLYNGFLDVKLGHLGWVGQRAEDEIERLRDHSWRENVPPVRPFLKGDALHFQVLISMGWNVVEHLVRGVRVN